MSNYWSQYWQQGHLTSFGEDIKGNYDGRLKSVWESAFANLKSDSTVLDIGTGNGALVALLYDVVDNSELPAIYAVDLATVCVDDELKAVSEKTEFISQVNCEHTSFGDNSFDLVVSQFGIEYSNLKKSIVEVSRLLKSGGVAKFVCHHKDSIIVKPNLSILRVSNEINRKGTGVDLLKQLVTELRLSGKGSPKSEKLRGKLNKTMEKMVKTDEAAFMATNFHHLVRAVLANIVATKADEIFNQFNGELMGSIERLTDLGNAALDKKSLSTIEHYCQQNDLNLNVMEDIFNENNELLGVSIEVQKR